MKKKLVQLVSLVMLFILAAAGCGKNNQNEKESDAAVNGDFDPTKQQANAEEYINCFDVRSIAASLKINGEAMSFPIDILKLKKDIKLNALTQTVSSHYYRGGLLDGDTEIGMAEFFSESGSPREDAYIYFLEIKEGSPWNLEINGVTFGASIDQTIVAIGDPIYRNGEEDGYYRIYYENCQYEFLAFAFEKGVLKTISFSYLPEEWRNR